MPPSRSVNPPTSPHMAYCPRSNPNFPGDIQHDVRDFLYDHRPVTLGKITGHCVDSYLQAAAIVDVKDDALADCLALTEQFDMHSLQVAHDHLAAFWRCQNFPILRGHPTPRFKGSDGFVSLQDCLNSFRTWLAHQTNLWATRHPLLVRRFCLVLVQQRTVQGYLAEMDLFDTLCAVYPVPPRTATPAPASAFPPPA